MKKLIWLTLFSIAMGYMESAIVVYLRQLYYPNGFIFPLTPIEPTIALTEFFREAATIIMLIGIGVLAGRTKAQRLSFFIYSFAIWDIFYYVFLKLILNWPESLFTWDILFLIPVPWVGPVIAPCIVSLTMILLAFVLLYFERRGNLIRLLWKDRLLIILGSAIVVFSFVLDYIRFIKENQASGWSPSSNQPMFTEIMQYVPQKFNWYIFTTGELILLLSIAFIWKRLKKQII